MRFFVVLFLSTMLISCGATVAVDYDTEVDFSQYRTFDFYPDIDSGLSALDNDRIVRITDSLMVDRGFTRSENPDLLINFYAKESIHESGNRMDIGIGRSTRNTGIMIATDIPIGGRVINQRLTIDFVDTQKDALVWQAEADGEMKERSGPKQKESYYLSLIQKVLKKYPPKSK